MKYYSYYREAYGAVLDGFLGEYTENQQTKTAKLLKQKVWFESLFSHCKDISIFTL